MRNNGRATRYVEPTPIPRDCAGCGAKTNCLHSLPDESDRRVCRACYAELTGEASKIPARGVFASVSIGDEVDVLWAKAGGYVDTKHATHHRRSKVIECKREVIITDDGRRFRRVDGTEIGHMKRDRGLYYARRAGANAR
jgi:hypothetical protein